KIVRRASLGTLFYSRCACSSPPPLPVGGRPNPGTLSANAGAARRLLAPACLRRGVLLHSQDPPLARPGSHPPRLRPLQSPRSHLL
uniref:Uncharacterized protein n=1 Tax=Aegilops tauschii subsp. strangulata TaxID=200361 RepID=A0A453LFY5_AEGTS